MAEYIEREALISEFKRMKLGENSFIERVFADGVYAVIEQLPAAEIDRPTKSQFKRMAAQMDYAHCRDYSGDLPLTYGLKRWTTVEMVDECKAVINQLTSHTIGIVPEYLIIKRNTDGSYTISAGGKSQVYETFEAVKELLRKAYKGTE